MINETRKRVFKLAHAFRKDDLMKGQSLRPWNEILSECWVIIKKYIPETIQKITYNWYRKDLKLPFNFETGERETKIIRVPVQKRVVLRNF